MKSVVIVGTGPAGVRAALELVAAGVRPIVIDEAARIGGQVYRQPASAVLQRPPQTLYGVQAPMAADLFSSWAALEQQVDYRPQTLVWQIEDRRLHLLTQGRADVLPFDALVLATGATDRVFPFPGWTLPGVFTLGGAQVFLKSQAAMIGPRVVFAGSGPLLYLVASQYLKAGARVQAVLDTAAVDAPLRALPGLLARPRLALAGMVMMAKLRAAGIMMRRGVTLTSAQGDEALTAITWSRNGRSETMDCDALAFGHGLRSETQLADLAGCAFGFVPVEQAWLPRCDENGRTSAQGVYIAGDGAGIRGADAAEIAGRLAARALLQDLGLPASPAQPDPTAMRQHERWRSAMTRLSQPPRRWAAEAPDDLVVCRCENVTAGELRECARNTGTHELNRLKALTRIGMGRCQGRMCGVSAAHLLADAAGCELQGVGRLRTQPPIKPIPAAALAAGMVDCPPTSDARDD